MFLQPDGTFWIQLLNFVIFFALLNLVFLRPVSAAIKKRRDYINGVTRDYEAYKAEAGKLKAQEDAVLAGARREAELTLGKERAEISNETATLAAQYNEQVNRQVEQAHETVAGELAAARSKEDKTVRELADMMLDRTVTGAAK
ncbi:MAG: ATP synthase F0 subunit B [Candidatus Eremiobacteraeota bacterium]|nr:ATP synthase F0 subunit B [Candidatus Eremiobacteraeota bacterium]